MSVLMDVYTRAVRAWNLSWSLGQELALIPLKYALNHYPAPEIHHSDQGTQYAANSYVKLLQNAGTIISMAAAGKPSENGYAERVIRTIKEEEVYLSDYENMAQARQEIGHFIDVVYRHKRIHSALGYLTPAEFEAEWYQKPPSNSEELTSEQYVETTTPPSPGPFPHDEGRGELAQWGSDGNKSLPLYGGGT